MDTHLPNRSCVSCAPTMESPHLLCDKIANEAGDLDRGQVKVASGEGNGSRVEGTFRHVASTVSPFREMVVGAYLRGTGQPELPELDVNGLLGTLSHQFTEPDQS